MRIFRREWFLCVVGVLFGRKKENIWSNGKYITLRGVITNEWHKIGKCEGCGSENSILTLHTVETTTEKNKTWRTYATKGLCTRCRKVNEIFRGEQR